MLFGPSWGPPLSDEAGTTLVILPVFTSLLTVLIPWAAPCPALMWGLRYDSDSPPCSFTVFALGLLSYQVPLPELLSSAAIVLPGSRLEKGHPTREQSYPILLPFSSLPFRVHRNDWSDCRGWRKTPLLYQR